MKFKLSIEKEVTKKYNYKTAKIKGFKTLSQLGLPSGYLGGRIHRIVELKDSDVFLALDHISNVIGVLKPIKEEVQEGVKSTNDDVVNDEHICEFCNRGFKSAVALSSHKRFCKEQ